MNLDQPNHEKELNKIRRQLYQEEEDHGSEQERMRNEISDLTEELRQKEITIATIMKKAALLERQLKMELEIKEKMLAKQQVRKRAGQPSAGSLSCPVETLVFLEEEQNTVFFGIVSETSIMEMLGGAP